jgi:hemerythrin-like domain-containing protein
MNKPVEDLEKEHRIIEKILASIAVIIEKIEAGGEVGNDLLKDIVNFMKNFADKCHHGKEETHLFSLLEKIGVPVKGCPLGILILEHQKARMLVKELSEAENAKAGLPALRGIFALYPGHIWKEDFLLFPMTEKMLAAEQLEKLAGDFESVENEMGADIHIKYTNLAEEISKKCEQL